MYYSLKDLSETYIETCFLSGVSDISKSIAEILFKSNSLQKFNYYFILTLKKDLDEIQNFIDEITLNYPGFNDVLSKMHKFIQIFTEKKFDYFLNCAGQNKDIFKDNDIVKFCKKYQVKFQNITL